MGDKYLICLNKKLLKMGYICALVFYLVLVEPFAAKAFKVIHFKVCNGKCLQIYQ